MNDWGPSNLWLFQSIYKFHHIRDYPLVHSFLCAAHFDYFFLALFRPRYSSFYFIFGLFFFGGGMSEEFVLAKQLNPIYIRMSHRYMNLLD